MRIRNSGIVMFVSYCILMKLNVMIVVMVRLKMRFYV